MSSSLCKIPIRGMHCTSCEILIGNNLKKIPGVTRVSVSHTQGIAEIEYAGSRPSESDLAKAVKLAGYTIGEREKLPWISRNPKEYASVFKAAFGVAVLYFIARSFGLLELDVRTSNSGIWVALVVGLVAGVSTCMALVGGLVLSLSARFAEKHPEATARQKFRPHLFFNLGRIGGYAILGGIIGFLGSAFSPSPRTLGALTVAVGLIMIFFGLKLVGIFPKLKEKSITLPASVARLFGLDQEIREYSARRSVALGVLTFFLPCGFTQAMQLYAISTGSFTQGMAVMMLFALGTTPGLLGIGALTAAVKGRVAHLFFVGSGIVVLLLGWYNVVNGGQLLWTAEPQTQQEEKRTQGEAQVIRMTQNGLGYSPSVLTVKKDVPIEWVVNSTQPFSCAASIVVPSYGISVQLRKGENMIRFTPTQVGEIPFSCAMGMYRGKFIVTE